LVAVYTRRTFLDGTLQKSNLVHQ